MAHPQKSTWKERQRWYHQVQRCGKSVQEVCQIFDVSRKTYYKWHAHDYGPKPSYRHSQMQPATKLTPAVKRFVVETKFKTNYGPKKMAMAIKRTFRITVSTTIIYRFYLKRRLIRRPQRRLPWYASLKEHLIIRNPGEGVQLDVKYVWAHNHRQYQFSVLDPYTEQFYFRVFPTRHSRNAVTALEEAERYWRFRIISVQTDNGSEFRGVFHIWCTLHDIPHYFIPKKSPWWNGKVERVHRTIDEEYYLNPNRVWKSPYDWLWFYNRERIHLSLGGLTPYEFLTQKCHP